jgi:hypothetical protein
MAELLEELGFAQEVIGSAEGNSFKRYRLEVTDTTRMLVITAQPYDEVSDPDIYVSNVNPLVSQESFVWKSTNIGPDKLEIHPDDPRFCAGTYFVGIYAYRSCLNTFAVKAEYALALPQTLLEDTYTGLLEAWSYFKFSVLHSGDSRLEIRVDLGQGQVALFVSNSLLYPDEDNHSYSAGYCEQSGEPMGEYINDIDPFADLMPRNYSRKPPAKDADKYRHSPPPLKEGPLVLCVDTDEWRYSGTEGYLAVKNLTASALQFTVSYREVLEQDLMQAEHAALYSQFKELFEDVEGSSISQTERKRMQLSGKSEFTYGEIDFMHMIPVFALVNPQPGEVFWDLGCGAGKCMAAMALLYPELKSVNGVEFLPGLHSLCVGSLEKLCREGTNVLLGDMLEVDWSDADIIFTSSICFPEELIEGILEKAKQLKVGTRIITLKSLPPNDAFVQAYSLRVKMTWGKTGVYVLEKVN